MFNIFRKKTLQPNNIKIENESKETRIFNILHIEDTSTDAVLVKKMLDGDNYKITQVDYISKGLKLVDKNKFDVVLLDLMLPDGQRLGSFIKVHDHSPDLPIIVLTSLGDEAIAIEALKQGAQDYLMKEAINKNSLVRSINYAVERQGILHDLKGQLQVARLINKLEDDEKAKFSESLFQHTTYPILVVDHKEIIHCANLEAQSLFRKENKELIGMKFKELTGAKFNFAQNMFGAVNDVIDLNFNDEDGKTYKFRGHVTETHWAGSIAFLVTLLEVDKQEASESK